MRNNRSTVTYVGMGFFEVLGLIFLVLKLTGQIDWSWWLVLLPIYGPIVLYIGGFLFFLLITFIIGGVRVLVRRRSYRKTKSAIKSWMDTATKEE